MVEGNAESIVLFPALTQGVLQLSDELAVPGFEDVQAGPFPGKEEDPEGKQGDSECCTSHHFKIRDSWGDSADAHPEPGGLSIRSESLDKHGLLPGFLGLFDGGQ